MIQPCLVLREEDDVVRTRIVRFVEEVALHAVDDLDVRALFLECARRVHRLRECLHNAVIGDRDGGPPPARRRFDEHLRRNDGIKCAHLRMGMQLDAFHLCGILALRHRTPLHAVDEKDVIADEFIVFDLALNADGTGLADRLEDTLDLGVDVLLCRFSACGKKFLARDAVRLVGKFKQQNVRARLELVRLRSEHLALEHDALDLVLDHAKLASLARDTAPKDDVCRQILWLCPLRQTRGCGSSGFLFHGRRHNRRRPLICAKLLKFGCHADNPTGTADIRTDSRLNALCHSTLREELRAECAGRGEANHIAVNFIISLPQCMEEHSIPARCLTNNALPQRCDSPLECDDILLHICARKPVIRRNLLCNRLSQFLIEDGGRTDDQFPRIFLCRDLDVTQCAGAQKRPLLIGENESAQQAEEHILRTWKNPIDLVHSS